jgi:hypothetical protein
MAQAMRARVKTKTPTIPPARPESVTISVHNMVSFLVSTCDIYANPIEIARTFIVQ